MLPDNVTELGSEVFAGNPTLASVKFGAGITAVSDGAFAGNDVIERLTIPKTVEAIGAGAFAGWSKLNTLTVSGDALASIGSKAFENAVLLADIYCEPTTAPTVAADSFAGAGASVQGAKTVHVPSVDAYSAWTAACSGYTFAALGDGYLSEGVYYRVSAGDQVVCGTSGILLDALRQDGRGQYGDERVAAECGGRRRQGTVRRGDRRSEPKPSTRARLFPPYSGTTKICRTSCCRRILPPWRSMFSADRV